MTRLRRATILTALFMSDKGQAKYYVFALRAATDITGTILVPAVLAAFAGQYLDNRYGTGKAFLAILLIVSFLFTIIALIRKVRTYGNAYQKLIGESGDSATRS